MKSSPASSTVKGPMERPMIVSDEMVRAILDGRKTQTRRIVKLPTSKHLDYRWDGAWKDGGPSSPFKAGEYLHIPFKAKVDEWLGQLERVFCPYGVAGDRLWVRETHAWADYVIDGFRREDAVCVAYKADGQILRHEGKPPINISDKTVNLEHSSIRWRPSIHMPRWASRITPEITKVRVERLQDISVVDAEREGMTWPSPVLNGRAGVVGAYALLWDSLYGKGAWDKNPWVWVLEFTRSGSSVEPKVT